MLGRSMLFMLLLVGIATSQQPINWGYSTPVPKIQDSALYTNDPVLEALQIGKLAGGQFVFAGVAKLLYGMGQMDYPTYQEMIISSNVAIRDYNSYVEKRWGNDTRLVNSLKMAEFSL